MSGLTLAQLRTRARRRADMANSAFVSDAEFDDYINEAGSQLWGLIVSNNPEIAIANSTVTTAAGTRQYDLPSDFQRMMAIWAQSNGGGRAMLEKATWHGTGEFYAYGVGSDNVNDSQGTPMYYMVIGGVSGTYRPTLELYPVPDGVYTIGIRYVPQYTRLEDDADTMNYPVLNGWERYVVLDAAMKALAKEESDVSQYLVELQRVEQNIVKQLTDGNDEFSARLVRDAYGATARFRRFNLGRRAPDWRWWV